MTFSERQGLTEKKTEIQINSMDDDLKNGLWDCLDLEIFAPIDDYTDEGINLKNKLRIRLWLNFFKEPTDQCPERKNEFILKLRRRFFNKFEWYEIYNFIEFIITAHDNSKQIETFIEKVNVILKRELSGYRIISSIIVPITSEIELSEVKKASKSSIEEVAEHIKRSLELLSDKKKPDYRNSIKESISAVETLCKKITKNEKATLGEALKKIEEEGKVKLHKALQSAYENLYGYTNDADGIRHALKNETDLDQEDALFFIVSCSAFINYLTEKVSKSDIEI